jgi:hypothetical protein
MNLGSDVNDAAAADEDRRGGKRSRSQACCNGMKGLKGTIRFSPLQFGVFLSVITRDKEVFKFKQELNSSETRGGIHQMFLQFFHNFSTIFLRLFPARIFRLFRAKS